MKKYIAKPNTWFKEGSECILVSDCENFGGIFSGIRVCEDNPNENSMGYKPGEEREDEELCSWDEFEIVENE